MKMFKIITLVAFKAIILANIAYSRSTTGTPSGLTTTQYEHSTCCDEDGYTSWQHPCGFVIVMPSPQTPTQTSQPVPSCSNFVLQLDKMAEIRFAVHELKRIISERIHDSSYRNLLEKSNTTIFPYANITNVTELQLAQQHTFGENVRRIYTITMTGSIYLEQLRYLHRHENLAEAFRSVVRLLNQIQCDLINVLGHSPATSTCEILPEDMVNSDFPRIQQDRRDYLVSRDLERAMAVVEETMKYIQDHSC